MNNESTAVAATEKVTLMEVPRFDEANHQRIRAEKNYAKVVELSGKLASYDARFAKLRAFVTAKCNAEILHNGLHPKDNYVIEFRNMVRMMKGKKPLRGH